MNERNIKNESKTYANANGGPSSCVWTYASLVTGPSINGELINGGGVATKLSLDDLTNQHYKNPIF